MEAAPAGKSRSIHGPARCLLFRIYAVFRMAGPSYFSSPAFGSMQNGRTRPRAYNGWWRQVTKLSKAIPCYPLSPRGWALRTHNPGNLSGGATIFGSMDALTNQSKEFIVLSLTCKIVMASERRFAIMAFCILTYSVVKVQLPSNIFHGFNSVSFLICALSGFGRHRIAHCRDAEIIYLFHKNIYTISVELCGL